MWATPLRAYGTAYGPLTDEASDRFAGATTRQEAAWPLRPSRGTAWSRTVGERLLVEALERHAHVLPGRRQVGELQVDHLRAVALGPTEHVGRLHGAVAGQLAYAERLPDLAGTRSATDIPSSFIGRPARARAPYDACAEIATNPRLGWTGAPRRASGTRGAPRCRVEGNGRGPDDEPPRSFCHDRLGSTDPGGERDLTRLTRWQCRPRSADAAQTEVGPRRLGAIGPRAVAAAVE